MQSQDTIGEWVVPAPSCPHSPSSLTLITPCMHNKSLYSSYHQRLWALMLCSACFALFIFPKYSLAFPPYFPYHFTSSFTKTPWTAILAPLPPLKPCSLLHLSFSLFMTRLLLPVACILDCTCIWTVRLIAQ